MEEHNKNNHKDFEELLRSMETRKTADLDDFEREALEGFALLDSTDEVRKLKSETDERIYTELFAGEKKKRPLFYWFAAAGLLLVIGLSIVFVTNTENLTGKKNVAQTITFEETPAKEQPVISSAENSAPLDNLKKSERENKLQEGKDFKRAKSSPSADEIFAKDQNSSYRSLNDKEGDATVFENTNAEKPAPAQNKLLEKEKAEDAKMLDEVNATTTKSNNQDNLAGAVVREEKKEQESKNKYKASNKKDAISSGKSEMPSAASGNNLSQNTSPASEAEEKSLKRSDDADSKPTDKAPKAIGENYCYYTGGKTALADELKKKFAEINLNKAFRATLYINEKKKVEKVSFTQKGELSSKEQKKVIEVLKNLQGFNFFIQPTQKGLHEFELNYTP